MKKFFGIFVFIFLFSASYVYAALPIGAYVGIGGGLPIDSSSKDGGSFKIDDSKTPFVSVSAGLRLMRFRGELEYLYRYENQNIKTENGEKRISSSSTMANLYYNFFEFPFIRLYVNGGVGYTNFNSKFIKSDKEFSYSLGVGAGITLGEMFTINAGYRYHDMGESEILNKNMHFYSNDVYVGIRIGF